MAEVVLFHHALGLTPGILAFADDLRRAGHTVHTPDLFEGRTFDTIEAGVGYAQEIGFDEVIERGARAVEELPAALVYGGFSLGELVAQKLAQTRPGARGALLFYSCIPVSEFSSSWPQSVPVQIHGMDDDPYFVGEGDIEAARALVAEAEDAELFLYPGNQHYFADSTLPSYDPEATALLTQRVLDFLAAR
jgi:dienelactone hydrolase